MPGREWLLTFDCSTPRTSVCLGWIDRARATAELVAHDDDADAPNQTSATLVPRIEKLLAAAGRRAGDLALVGTGCGPGTFTGSRVALATAKGLALGLGVPLLPVATLAAVALGGGHAGTVLATLDARRGEVYCAPFRCADLDAPIPSCEALAEPRCVPLADALVDLDPTAVLVGPGATAYRDVVPADRRVLDTRLGARGLWGASCRRALDGDPIDPALAEVTYLRKSYAELGVNRPKRPFVRSPFV